MSYEPRGKVSLLLGAMDASAEPVWTAVQVADRMGVSKSNFEKHLVAVLSRDMLFRTMVDGKRYFSRRQFPEGWAPSQEPKPTALNIPTMSVPGCWTPPKMTAPRGESPRTMRRELPRPADDAESRFIAAQNDSLNKILAERAASPPPAPPAIEESEPEAEVATEFTARRWADGDIDLFGLLELDDGGMRLPAASVPKLLELLGAVRC